MKAESVAGSSVADPRRPMFKKILIANRGEIACRVIRTARRMGIATVAVFSEADRSALHVALADESVEIGPAPARQSYLAIDGIVAACKETGAEAVHPGYGFLSENPEFCRRLERAGIVFIGPGAEAIEAMGDKIAAKKLAAEAGVNVIPGHDGVVASAPEAVKIARAIGYPVMIKASAGGGGRGLRLAANDAECREGYASCRTEAKNAFGDDRVFIEKFIEAPRHIEIQVVGDAHGNVIHLGERECSIQRRHQKMLEEAPSPFLVAATRAAMGEQAVRLARAGQYRSAGTVEFVVDRDRRFYFLEMNTRLQVEHPVTEMVTGLDLVELMIRVAGGEKLPLAQQDVRSGGWAIECRINAEDPLRNFLPSVGRLIKYLPPPDQDGAVRVDTGVVEGGEITIHYDSLIAKLICHGPTREAAVLRLRGALDAFAIRGVFTTIGFHAALMHHPRFLTGDFTTGFMAEAFPQGFHPVDMTPHDPLLFASVAAFARMKYIGRAAAVTGRMAGRDRVVARDWVALMGTAHHALRLTPIAGGYSIVCAGRVNELVSAWKPGDILFRGTWNGNPVCLQIERRSLRYRVSHGGAAADITVMTARDARLLSLVPEKPAPDRSHVLVSPMPGLVTEIAVEPGQEVKAGEKLAVIEAMKMENILRAERDCVIAEVLVGKGESLAADQPILRFA